MESSVSFTKELWGLLSSNPTEIITWLGDEVANNPVHVSVEVLCVVFILYMWMQRPFKPDGKPTGEEPTKEEKEEMIKAWKPEKLVVKGNSNVVESEHVAKVVLDVDDTHLDFKDHGRCRDFSSFNYLRMAKHETVVKNSLETIDHFGVGSCGPRGFYGTVQPHLVLEEQLQTLYNTPNAIVYSFQYATMASIIPAFAGRQDVLVVDKGINMAIMSGVNLSRSKVHFFDHNNMESLEEALKLVAKKQKDKPTRRWIIAEGVYRNYGDVCRLPEVMALKEKYKFRLMLDDSYGSGGMGKSGLGTAEAFNIPTMDIDVYTGSLDTGFGSTGGFCVGGNLIVTHQVLAGVGYCFSASLPPFAAVAATTTLEILSGNTTRLQNLAHNKATILKALEEAKALFCNSDASPIFHVYGFAKDSAVPAASQHAAMAEAADVLLRNHQISVTHPIYTDERFPPPPSVRIVASSEHKPEDLKAAVNTIAKVVADCARKAK